ncbi:MAG: MFS transporter [Thaumarchaeota archaeon]|nr:MFS transporter [Nitrososphaerota archaeon]
MSGDEGRLHSIIGIPTLGFLMATSLQIASPILSLFLYETYSLSLTEIGFILSIYHSSSFFAQISVGASIKTSRVYPALIAAFLIMAAGYIGLAISPLPIIFIAVSILLGVGVALNRTTQLSAATILSSKDRVSESMRNYTAALGLGFTAGPAVGAAAVGLLGIKNTIMLPGAVSLIGALLALHIIRSVSIREEDVRETQRLSWKEAVGLLKNRQVLTAAIAFLDLAVINSVLAAYAPIHAKEVFHLQDSVIVSLFLGLAVITFLSRFLIRRSLSDRKLIALMTLGLVSATIGLSAVAYSPTFWVFAAGFLLIGLQQGLVLPLAALVIAGNTTTPQRVLGNAIGLGGQDAGRILGPLTASIIVAGYGTASTIGLYTAVPIIVIGLALAVKLTASPHGNMHTK